MGALLCADLLQQFWQQIKVPQLVQKVTGSERRGRAAVFAQVVIREYDGGNLSQLATVDRPEHTETRTAAQMQIQKCHIHSLALHGGDGVCLVVHGSGKLYAGHMGDGFPQPIRE